MAGKARSSEDADSAAAPPTRMVKGREVIDDRPVESPLTRALGKQVLFTGFRLLTLEDGQQVYGCADCDATGTRGEIQRHRATEHGAGRSGAKPASGGKGQDLDVLSLMTIGELLVMAQDAVQWGDAVAVVEKERDDWRARALTAEGHLKKLTFALKRAGFTVEKD